MAPLHLDADDEPDDEAPAAPAPARRGRQCRHCVEAAEIVSRESRLGFPSKPPADQWAPRLRALGDAARAQPCKADKIMVSFERPFGFGSRMNAFIDEIFYAIYGNYSLAVCGSKTDGFYKRVWSPFFENLVDLPVCTAAHPLCGEEDAETMWPGMMLSELLGVADPEYLVKVKGYLTRLALTPTPAFKSQVHRRLVEAGLHSKDSQPSYIGMHIRRGDKILWEAKATPASTFAKEAKRYLQNTSREGSAVYLASDDAAVHEDLGRALGPKFAVLRQSWSANTADRDYEDAGAVLQIFADVEALTKAELFIGSASSNIGRLIYMLRGPKRPSISVDDDGQWLRRG